MKKSKRYSARLGALSYVSDSAVHLLKTLKDMGKSMDDYSFYKEGEQVLASLILQDAQDEAHAKHRSTE